MYTVYVYACIRLRRVHGVWSYNVGDGCTAKNGILFIQFQLLILRFVLVFFTFLLSLLLMELNFIFWQNESVASNLNHTGHSSVQFCISAVKSTVHWSVECVLLSINNIELVLQVSYWETLMALHRCALLPATRSSAFWKPKDWRLWFLKISITSLKRLLLFASIWNATERCVYTIQLNIFINLEFC